MESRDFVYLQEAYQQMYQLDEEVEIATEYFYEMGLNEYGVNALIEELGVEEFVEWVYDIAESYTLTEARAGGSRIEPVTKSGKAIGSLKGGARTAAINRLRKEKQARREAEERESAERPSRMKAALRSQAMKAAAKSQPKAKKEVSSETKKGIGGLVSRAVSSYKAGTERHKEATEKTKETLGKLGRGLSQAWQTAADSKLGQAGRVQVKKGLRRQQKAIEKVAPAIGGATGRLASRVPAIVSTYKAGERLGRALREDEEFEAWVEGLWEEGYDLSDYTWEGLYEVFVESRDVEAYGQDELSKDWDERNLRNRGDLAKRDAGSIARSRLKKEPSPVRPVRGSKPHTDGRMTRNESYDVILEYLLDEGYADTIESAESIMNSMSEEWIDEILDEAEKVFPLGKVADKMRQLQTRMKASKSPEEQSRLRKRLNKMGDEYWQPN